MESSRKTIAKCLTARGQADLHSGLQLIKEPLKIRSANSRGYDEAYVGDSINLTAINSTTRRGRVGDQKAQTLDTKCDQAVIQPKIIGYTRDAKGKVTDRHLKDVAGTIHSSSGSGGNTDQFVLDKNYTYQAVNKTIEQNEDKLIEGQAIMMDLYNKSLRDISPTLIDPKHNSAALFDGYRIRRLHPVETERLQGFPDNHTEYGNYDGVVKLVSKSQRYKQCGNAVTVDVVHAIAEKLKPIFKFK
jgi:DNA (cytosine-5)-methyltransferase 1